MINILISEAKFAETHLNMQEAAKKFYSSLDNRDINSVLCARSTNNQQNKSTRSIVMKKIKLGTLHGWARSIVQGWVRKVCILTLGGVLLTSTAMAADGSAGMSQYEFIRWMVQLSDETPLFGVNATSADYVQWARDRGMNPTGGWNAESSLTPEVLAQVLVQFFNINPKKQGTDYLRILEREGIVIPTGPIVARSDFVGIIDEFGMQARTAKMAKKKKTVLCPPKTPGKPPKLKSKCSPPKTKPKPPKVKAKKSTPKPPKPRK